MDRINLATKKGLTSYWTPEQICNEIHAESMNVWQKYVDQFDKNKKMDVFMRPFQFTEDIIITAGNGIIVTKDYIYYIEDTNTGVEIHQVDDKKWGYRSSHPVKTPTPEYPICNTFNQEIKVLPVSITSVTVSFLKKPTKPVWAYTISSGRYVYDDSSSIDFEWNEILHDPIMNRVLGNLGISARDGELLNQSARDKATEGL